MTPICLPTWVGVMFLDFFFFNVSYVPWFFSTCVIFLDFWRLDNPTTIPSAGKLIWCGEWRAQLQLTLKGKLWATNCRNQRQILFQLYNYPASLRRKIEFHSEIKSNEATNSKVVWWLHFCDQHISEYYSESLRSYSLTN